MKQTRPAIPKKTQIKLWTAAGGRCEFLGCNKLLWQDELTIREMNRSNIAHIISWKPSGPRGDGKKSAELAVSFENLMLVCLDHGKLIDDKNYEKEFSVEKLYSFKKTHEDRILQQTSFQKNYKTKILRFTANIANRKTNIQFAEICSAISPKYPSDNKGIEINFGNLKGDGNSEYWNVIANQINHQVKDALKPGVNDASIEHLSIFALGPIPLLIQLGASIGNCIPFDIYQFHRDTNSWNWKDESSWSGFKVGKTYIDKKSKNTALLLSLSGKIHPTEIPKQLNIGSMYEIYIDNPTPQFLTQNFILNEFKKVYRKSLNEIRETNGDDAKILVLPAIPAPVAVLCGTELLPKIDPEILIYDNNKLKKGFNYCFTLAKI